MWKPDNDSHPWLSSLLAVTSSLHNSTLQEGNSSVLPPLHSPSPSDLPFELNSSGEGFPAIPNCIPPSISEFPDDFFSPKQRLHGGFLVHALIVAYVCAMLAIVCDRYFVPSLKVISNYFNVPADIAGATFMAIGTSSPELFSSVIGAFVAKGDIGIGTVVGSAVFNMLAVTGVSGIAIGALSANLEWYPITRDCLVYVITVASLVIVIHDNVVTWIEATVLLLMFVCYLGLLYFNSSVKKATTKTVKNVKGWWYTERYYDLQKMKVGLLDETSPLVIDSGKEYLRYQSYNDSACPSSESSSVLVASGESDGQTVVDCDALSQKLATSTKNNSSSLSSSYNNLHEFEESSEFSLCRPPPGVFRKIVWLVMWPADFLFYITIPNCTTEGKLLWFPLTFFSSVVWLGVLSYITFWMVAIIGYTLGIPDTVSGITILAAGTSVPELVASVIVVKSGLANMAISNLIGSNIFDILFCLGLPWLVKTLINVDTHTMVINSSALTYTTTMLLLTVVLFYTALILCGWKLSWRVGLISLALYAAFLVVASLYESNVFGDFNPPVCPTS